MLEANGQAVVSLGADIADRGGEEGVYIQELERREGLLEPQVGLRTRWGEEMAAANYPDRVVQQMAMG